MVCFLLSIWNHNNDKSVSHSAPIRKQKTDYDRHSNLSLFAHPTFYSLSSVFILMHLFLSVNLFSFALLLAKQLHLTVAGLVFFFSLLLWTFLNRPDLSFVSLCSSVLLASCRRGKTESNVFQSGVLKCSASQPRVTPRMRLLKSQVDQVHSPPSAGLTTNQYESRLIAVNS